MTMVSYVPKTSRSVILVSSMHHDDNIYEATGDLHKPELVTFYNCTKAGVDVCDQLCSTYSVSRRTKRWTLAVFFHFLNVAAHNALVLYKMNTASPMQIKRRIFLKQLSQELVKNHQILLFTASPQKFTKANSCSTKYTWEYFASTQSTWTFLGKVCKVSQKKLQQILSYLQ